MDPLVPSAYRRACVVNARTGRNGMTPFLSLRLLPPFSREPFLLQENHRDSIWPWFSGDSGTGIYAVGRWDTESFPGDKTKNSSAPATHLRWIGQLWRPVPSFLYQDLGWSCRWGSRHPARSQGRGILITKVLGNGKRASRTHPAPLSLLAQWGARAPSDHLLL